MAQLVSPGVAVSVTDESFYAGASQGTVPLIVFATQSNKPNPNQADATQSSIAPGTTATEAGKLQLVTSQRELIQTFGEPIFITDQGTPSHGNELNEYGLHAAWQYLGISDRAYVVRADVPLEELSPSNIAPTGPVPDGTYWLDLLTTSFGIFQGDGTDWIEIQSDFYSFNATTNTVNDASGDDGDFAIDIGSTVANLGIFEKISGVWYRLGTADWITAKGNTSLIGGGSGPATLVYAPHTGVAPTNQVPLAHDQHIWVRTTEPNGGADYSVKRYSDTNEGFSSIYAPLFETETEASLFYNDSNTLVSGVLFVDFNASNATHVIKRWTGSAWAALTYIADEAEPTADPVEGTLWYSTDLKIDIMVNDGSNWLGYKNSFVNTDPAGPIISATKPSMQSDGTALVNEDLWIDTSDLDNYPRIWRYRNGSFHLIDNSDQTTVNGIVFKDARGGIEAGTSGISSTVDGLTTNDVDSDAPDAKLYPAGVLLFNTRFSTYNVKEWQPEWLLDDPNGNTGRFVTVSGNKTDGSPWMGRKAQRRVIVNAMQAAIANNDDLRSEFVFFNLIASPGYPEMIGEMISLNTDIKEIACIVGDTPSRLVANGQAIQEYATNANGEALNGEDGRTGINNPYVAQYYPWGLGTNIDGGDVMVPPSTIALRTIAYSDQVSFPWFAPAGYLRGIVSNADSVGYLNSEDEYQSVILSEGLRNVLQLNNINPISLQPNKGLVVFGQKTLNPVSSALDRVNVARLINFIRYNAEELLKPFLFEPNDGETRAAAEVTMSRFLSDLIGQRALADFGVRCDDTNNTPERIDRNELWCDVAIIPIKSVEFIYIPIRILNTGEDVG